MIGGTDRLTVAGKMVVHLSHYSRFRDEPVCPYEMTQYGISEKVGISRGHVAVELKKLEDADLVKSKVAHVTGAFTRRKVYCLTRDGETIASWLKKRMKIEVSAPLQGSLVLDHPGEGELRGIRSVVT